ncbi:DUF1746-domain-containing protein [Pleomassaria siparia CBS 279.74]|uniref:DUF1746-domain-containing protein n=1 Tax=Pleomassaria siparia CBS 279.74 TaxID=1314801 RepID=A0A6G1JXA5_9PLEO|nr:DUF1746-domain-containing protein [Pleomassaria siparia CBS 279.74]
MDDEAESSRAGLLRRANSSSEHRDADFDSEHEHEHEHARADAEEDHDDGEDALERERVAKERRVDAKRKRILFLEHLLRELDTLVFLELITIYHLDCSFFWFLVRTIIHVSLLTPLPDLALAHQHDEHKPLLLIIVSSTITFLLHVFYPAPSAGEDTRGYLHGGLMIDFIGQEGPTGKWKLVGLDICLIVLQLVMVAVHVKRRVLKRNLAKLAGGTPATPATEGETAQREADNTAVETATATVTAAAVSTNAEREQDADSEERGVLRRTDTLSDMGVDHDEEDALLASSSESNNADAFETLSSGQCVIGDFTLIDTLIQEHHNYNEYRQTLAEAGASSSLSPGTLRQLQVIRMRFGAGGG